MNLSSPLTDLISGVRGELLQVLFRLEKPVTRRHLADMSGVAAGNASSVIEELILVGIIREERVGRSSLVSLNRTNLLSKGLEGIIGVRDNFFTLLSNQVKGIDGVLAAWLFGSVARGDSNVDSDVDVLIVGEDLDSSTFHNGLSGLYEKVKNWTGNDLQITEYSLDAFNTFVQSDNPLVNEIRVDGILLCNIGDLADFK